MRSFFALLWDPASPAAEFAARTAISRIDRARTGPGLSAPGLLILDLSDNPSSASLVPIISSDGELAGAAFGTLFERDGAGGADRRVREITGRPADLLIASGGSAATGMYWGSYVMILRTGVRASLIADPLSSIPCFYWISDGLTRAFSNLEKCTFLDFRQLSFNHEFLTALLRYDKVQTGETGFREIRELCAGMRLQQEGELLSSGCVWDPAQFAAAGISRRTPDLADELRETVLRAVRSWSTVFERIVVNVSGGLDSSIVLASLCASGGPENVVPLHHILDSDDPGEASYAQDVCAFLGLDLKTVHMPATQEFPAPGSHPLTVRPYRDFLAGRLDRVLGTDIMRGADAVFTGQGGDHLFLVSDSPLGFADYVRTNVPGPRIWRELLAAARLSGRSIWRVLNEAFISASARKESLMARALRERAMSASHLGVEPPDAGAFAACRSPHADKLPPAKSDQVSIMSHLVHLRDGIGRSGNLQIVHPLMAQPILELCLRIPVYELCTDGISRGLARQAFSGLIPDSIRLRMTKGHAGMYFSSRLDANRELLCRTLLEGELAASGMVDRQKLSDVLTSGQYRTMNFGNRLLVFYAIEAWLTSWQSFFRGNNPSGLHGESPRASRN